jgi:hypothetical protein
LGSPTIPFSRNNVQFQLIDGNCSTEWARCSSVSDCAQRRKKITKDFTPAKGHPSCEKNIESYPNK